MMEVHSTKPIDSLDASGCELLLHGFARLVLQHLTNPAAVPVKQLEIPLENLFRLSEMFRHDTWDDGINHSNWAVHIRPAVMFSMARLSYRYQLVGAANSDFLQRCLRDLTNPSVYTAQQRDYLREFLDEVVWGLNNPHLLEGV